MSASGDPSPAIRSYFFGKGYADLWQTIQASWARNLADAADFWAKAEAAQATTTQEGPYQAAMYYAAAFSVLVFGTVVFGAISLVHVTLLLTLFATIYVLFGATWLADRTYQRVRGWVTTCPVCHERAPLPEYLCERCGRWHPHLEPSSYGILRHQCRCGNVLPATFWLQRGALPSRCRHCKQSLVREHTEARPVHVAMLGGPSVGKSAFVFAAVDRLVQAAPTVGWSTGFPVDADQDTYVRVRDMLADGRRPEKTTRILPRALNVLVSREGDARLVYLYDPAGEVHDASEGMRGHRFQTYLTGAVLVIDPFALPRVREAYAERLAKGGVDVSPSTADPEDTLSSYLIALDRFHGKTRASVVDTPLAVVVNKVDAFDLEELLWVGDGDDGDALVRRVLELWGAGPLVHKLTTRFSRVRFFTTAALGRLPSGAGGAGVGRGVLAPLLWVLHAGDGGFGWSRAR